MTFDLSKIQSMFGFGLSVFGAVAGGVMWYRGSVQKSYAAERDFNHLKRNQENLAIAVKQIDDGVESLRDETNDRLHQANSELAQIKTLLSILISKNGDSVSAILGREK